MLNQLVLVGRLTNIIDRDGSTIITIATPRSFKNENGEYETDYIDCVIWGSVAENTKEYCKKGDMIGVRGRIQTKIIEDSKVTELVAERITFLSSQSEKMKEGMKNEN